MSEEVEVNEQPAAKPSKKTAPKVAVNSSPVKSRTIDDLFSEFPGQQFMYAPIGTSPEALAEEGLEVVVKSGVQMVHKNRLICRCIGSVQANKMRTEYTESTNSISHIREIESEDKQSHEKKPNVKRLYDADVADMRT